MSQRKGLAAATTGRAGGDGYRADAIPSAAADGTAPVQGEGYDRHDRETLKHLDEAYFDKKGGQPMKSFASKLFAFFVFALLCAAAFPTAALAKPIIKFSIEHVYLHEAGEAEIVGYYVNEGDQGAYAKWTDLDLTLIADNGQQMWSDAGIRHYVDDIYVDPGEYIAYTFYVQNQDIPEYHGKYRWRYHTSTHWEKAAG